MKKSELRKIIRESIKEIMEGKIVRYEIPTKDKKKVQSIVKKLKLKDTKDYAIYGSGRTFEIELDSKFRNKFLECSSKDMAKIIKEDFDKRLQRAYDSNELQGSADFTWRLSDF